MANPKTNTSAAKIEVTSSVIPAALLPPSRPLVHIVLQGKGGAGKTAVSCLLSQYLSYKADYAEEEAHAPRPLVLDTDPINQSLTAYHGQDFDVQHISLTDEDNITINSRRFDEMMEVIFQQSKPHAVVIDTGSSNFLQLVNYVKRCSIPSVLSDAGYTLVLHVVIAGGSMLIETLQSLDTICDNLSAFKPLNIVVWTNPVNGNAVADANWSRVQDSNTYKDHADDIRAVINLPLLDKDLQREDFKELLKNHHTFQSAIDKQSKLAISYNTLSRLRLKGIREVIWEQIDQAFEALP